MSDKIVNQFMAEKAGMKAVDKAQISRKVQAMTKGTNKYLFEKQLQQKRKIQIDHMLRKIQSYQNDPDKHFIKKQIEEKIAEIEKFRDLSRVWAHFDFDMFYVACELLDRPELADKPCAVGSDDGVLCTANYVARNYGVRSAIPTFIAKKLCPELVLIQPNFEKYKKYSNIFREILSQFDENYQSMGLDEAYVDLTQNLAGRTLVQMQDFVRGIRNRIFQATNLTVSCGVAANKMLCKMASQQRKPNNQFILSSDRQAILSYISSKPTRKIPGIGPVNQLFLKGLGITTGQQLLTHMDHISICFSQHTTQSFIFSALGISRNTHEFKDRKSVGRSDTFRATDIRVLWFDMLDQLSERVAQDLQELDLMAKTVTLSYQFSNFQKRDRSQTLDAYVNGKKEIYEAAEKMLKEVKQGMKLRLVGVRCTNLISQEAFKKNSLENYLIKTVVKKEPQRTVASKPSQIAPSVKRGAEKQEHSIIQQPPQKQQSQSRSQLSHPIPKPTSNQPKPMDYQCPVCNQIINCRGNYSKFDRHINKCLQDQLAGTRIEQAEPVEPPSHVERRKRQASPQQPKSPHSQHKPKRGRKKQEPVNQSSLLAFIKK